MTGRRQETLARDARMSEMAERGMTSLEIAGAENVSLCTVYDWARKCGKALQKRPSQTRNASNLRAEKMASMYRQGVTLQKIADQHDITRERVRQILKSVGITAQEGGASVVSAAKSAARAQARETQCMVKYGQPLAVVQQLRKDGVLSAYRSQRAHAAIRAIEWNLTFQQWFAIWQSSGKLHLRGRGKGKYVMSRVSDAGCYELGNVHIQLATENSKEAVAKWKGKTKPNKGVYCLYPGRELAWFARVGKKPLGFFATEAEAVAARVAFFQTNPDAQTRSTGRGYAHIKAQKGRSERFQVMVGKKYVGCYPTPEAALAARAAYLEAFAKQGAAVEAKPAQAA